MKKRTKSKKPRDLHALNAIQRKSAGPMKKKTKKDKRVIFEELMEGVEFMKNNRGEKC
jgi:hypothetical protein